MNAFWKILSVFGRIFFIMWLSLIGIVTVHAFYKIIMEKSAYHQVVVYSALGGFLLGAVASYIPARIAQRREVKAATEEINRRTASAVKRIQPLRDKMNKAIQDFMEAVASGDVEEAMKQKNEAGRLFSLIDVLVGEQLGRDSGPDKD